MIKALYAMLGVNMWRQAVTELDFEDAAWEKMVEKARNTSAQIVICRCEGFEDGTYYGRSRREAPESDGVIRFFAQREILPGEYVQVRITGCEAYDLYGEEIEE